MTQTTAALSTKLTTNNYVEDREPAEVTAAVRSDMTRNRRDDPTRRSATRTAATASARRDVGGQSSRCRRLSAPTISSAAAAPQPTGRVARSSGVFTWAALADLRPARPHRTADELIGRRRRPVSSAADADMRWLYETKLQIDL